jgi:hypothetical protein
MTVKEPSLLERIGETLHGWWKALFGILILTLLIAAIAIAASSSGNSSHNNASDETTLARPTVAPAASVVILNNTESASGVCTGSGLSFRWVVNGAHPGDQVTVRFSGPGLPDQQTFTVGTDGSFGQTYPVSGSGTWTSDIISVAGKTPTSNTHNSATSSCI